MVISYAIVHGAVLNNTDKYRGNKLIKQKNPHQQILKLRSLERKLGCKLSQSLSGLSEKLLHVFLHQNNDALIGYFNNNNKK